MRLKREMCMRACGALVAGVAALGLTTEAFADGDEMLGLIPVADGTDVVVAGVGLRGFNGQPNSIEITIPAGVTIQQVLLYWNGFASNADEQGEMDTILVDGAPITGDRIGGPNFFFNNAWSSSYRVELSPDTLVMGANSIEIDGLDFGQSNNGAGLLVIVDDGMNSTDIQVADGDDTAFSGFPSPRDITEPVTYSFTPATEDRVGELNSFAASVFTDTCRPNTLRIYFDGVLADELENPFRSADGQQWDSFTTPVTVPAGASSMTVQAVSANLGNECPPDALDASLVWIVSAFTIQDVMMGDEGCTPGYWKQPHHFDSWPAPYTPDTLFSDVFEDAFPGLTLLEVMRQRASADPGPNQLNSLGRHTVAALLNASSADVAYCTSAMDVIDSFNDVYPGTIEEYNDLKFFFSDCNEAGCPLNGGDPKRDGLVDFRDMRVLMTNWGTPGPGDLDRSGVIDLDDLMLLLSR